MATKKSTEDVTEIPAEKAITMPTLSPEMQEYVDSINGYEVPERVGEENPAGE